MAYSGYLLAIGNWKVPAKYILPDSYKVGHAKTKLADWTDYNNERHVVYSKKAFTTISFQTPQNFKITDEDMALFHEALQNARSVVIIDDTNSKVHDDMYQLVFYNPETDEYLINDFTLEGLEFTINGITDKNVYYSPLQFTFEEVDPDDL